MKNNKQSNIRKILIVACIVVTIFLIYEIIHIYALLHSETSGTVSFQNGVWNIYVNGTQISNGGVTASFVIDNIEIDSNQHIKANTIAPRIIWDI